jgi:hypothetical protein
MIFSSSAFCSPSPKSINPQSPLDLPKASLNASSNKGRFLKGISLPTKIKFFLANPN